MKRTSIYKKLRLKLLKILTVIFVHTFYNTITTILYLLNVTVEHCILTLLMIALRREK